MRRFGTYLVACLQQTRAGRRVLVWCNQLCHLAYQPYQLIKTGAPRTYRRWRRAYRDVQDRKRHKQTIIGLAKPTPNSSRVVCKRLKPQLQSALLQLPAEVRLLIWEYCVGHLFIYHPMPKARGPHDPPNHSMVSNSHRLFIACYVPYPNKPNSRPTSPWASTSHIRAVDRPGATRFPGLHDLAIFIPSWQPSRLVPRQREIRLEVSSMTRRGFARKGDHWTAIELLSTCSQIYEEVLPTMLATNTFAFNYLEHFNFFRTHICAQRFSSIRYLHLGLVLTHENVTVWYPGLVDQDHWSALWKTIDRELTSLRELDLELFVPNGVDMLRWLKHGASISRRSRKEWFQALPGWADDLRFLRGRLRRARFVVTPERFVVPPQHYFDSEEFFSNSEDVYALRSSASIIELASRLQDVQAFVTSNGRGA